MSGQKIIDGLQEALDAEVIRLRASRAQLIAANAALVVRDHAARTVIEALLAGSNGLRSVASERAARAWLAGEDALPPGYEALLAFVEEVRDHKPDVISGRASDPQDDLDDMIEAGTFYAFQADAEKLAPKPKKKDAA